LREGNIQPVAKIGLEGPHQSIREVSCGGKMRRGKKSCILVKGTDDKARATPEEALSVRIQCRGGFQWGNLCARIGSKEGNVAKKVAIPDFSGKEVARA